MAGTYVFDVTAWNSEGGATSAASAPFVVDVPQAPIGVVAVASPNTVVVSWTASVVDARYPVDTYDVVASLLAAGKCTVAAPSTSCQLVGLRAGFVITFTVRAHNAAGYSTRSAPSAAVTTLPPTPAPPSSPPPPPPLLDRIAPAPVTSLNAAGRQTADGTLGALLSWVPTSDTTAVQVGVANGAVVVGQSLPGVTVSSTTTGATVTGLRAGVTYNFAVAPVDAAGNVGSAMRVALAGTSVRTLAPLTTNAGRVVPVAFTLRDLGGKGLGSSPVQVLVRPAAGGGWRVYKSANTNSLGVLSVSPRLASSTQFALRYAGELGHAGVAAGGVVTVRVRATVAATVTVGGVAGLHVATRGVRATLSGSVAPNKRGRGVYLQKLVGTAWKNIAVTTVGTTSSYGFVLPTAVRGTTTYRVACPADAANLAGYSAVQVFAVS
jgi:hypothetical protein